MLKMTAPSLALDVPADRPYAVILTQTRQVYNQLLHDKQAKLNDQLLQRKAQFDEKCAQVAQIMGDEKALEYGVRAQEDLNRMQSQNDTAVLTLAQDYQRKLDDMKLQYEQKWLQQGRI